MDFFFFFFEEEGRGYLLMIPRAANIKCQKIRGIIQLASFLNKGVALSPVHPSSNIYLTSSLISPISSFLIIREKARHFENFAHVILLTLLPLLPSFC